MKKLFWIFVFIAIVFIVVQFYFSTSRGPVKTTWSEVRSTMLANHDIERIVVINDKIATVYIKKDRLDKYKTQFDSSFEKPADGGPHFTFNIGSVETLENNLKEAQKVAGKRFRSNIRKNETGQGKFYGQSGQLY